MINEIVLAFGTLFPIVNPFSTSLIFNQLTAGYGRAEKLKVAVKAALVSCFAMLVFLLIGKQILLFFGVTIYAFRVAGGIYLARIGFQMLDPAPYRKPENYNHGRDSVAVIPVAIPLLSGPGALTSVLVMTSEYPGAAIVLAILLVSAVSYIVLRLSDRVEKGLGRTGSNVLERLLGLMVLVMAVQFAFNGITGYLDEMGLV